MAVPKLRVTMIGLDELCVLSKAGYRRNSTAKGDPSLFSTATSGTQVILAENGLGS